MQTAIFLPLLMGAACLVALLMVYCVSRMLDKNNPTHQTLQTIEMQIPLQDMTHTDFDSDSEDSI